MLKTQFKGVTYIKKSEIVDMRCYNDCGHFAIGQRCIGSRMLCLQYWIQFSLENWYFRLLIRRMMRSTHMNLFSFNSNKSVNEIDQNIHKVHFLRNEKSSFLKKRINFILELERTW